MAALAAILILAPGVALAQACDQTGSFSIVDLFPALRAWVDASAQKAQLEQLLSPASLVGYVVLIWLIASNSVRPAIVALCWFGASALYLTYSQFSGDQGSLPADCVAAPTRGLSMAWTFVALAGWLTWQRMKRQNQR